MMTITRHPIQYGVVYSTSSYTILYVVTNINNITHTQNENLPYIRIYIYICVILNVCVVHVLCTVVRVHVCVSTCVCVRAHTGFKLWHT